MFEIASVYRPSEADDDQAKSAAVWDTTNGEGWLYELVKSPCGWTYQGGLLSCILVELRPSQHRPSGELRYSWRG